MPESSGWQEVESEVYYPKIRLVLAVGAFFLLIGFPSCVAVPFLALPGILFWVALLSSTACAVVGGAVCVVALRAIIAPARVLNAGVDALPAVPREPVLLEGSVLHSRFSYELEEDFDHWHFQPTERCWRDGKGVQLGFGILLTILFAGLLSWILHSQLNFAGWPISILCATLATAVCGTLPYLLIGHATRTTFRRLPSLSIPKNGDDLTLESPAEPDSDKADLTAIKYWVFQGTIDRKRRAIARKSLIAVQLCPWKIVTAEPGGLEMTWAVQGSLVLARSAEGTHQRLPILLTGSFVGAARLMEQLARALDVPYLFCADAEGWQAEEDRASRRPPLRTGVVQL